MELIYFLIGLVGGGVLMFFYFKNSSVSRNEYSDLNSQVIKQESDLENLQQKLLESENIVISEKQNSKQLSELVHIHQTDYVKLSSEYNSLLQQFQESKIHNKEQIQIIESLQFEKQDILQENTELKIKNHHIQESLELQKNELLKIQQESKLQFENIANKILEEKSEKYSSLHQNQLKTILEPFQEKLTELKNRVNEAYDTENKERFSLAEKVKELAELNQQISEDAKKLTKALKGESKTQGNWGEMILENILEKSGLVKGREYFLEHELKDEDNKALYSEFSGKKMRPDAVIKYPDERNVIIDSKVSLTAFTSMVDETDAEIYKMKTHQHLQSIKNHIQQLSQKAYDDYGKSLDFVMMFIPSEPAYIAAMQSDHNLWNYAYERRILLLNPSNLITSLKLIADLWKREHQNRNALEIAERGSKLYDKFTLFIDNLEKIGKNLDQAKSSYHDAFSQLTHGRDNLILQTQKLKSLGIKNKKELPQSLIDQSLNEEN